MARLATKWPQSFWVFWSRRVPSSSIQYDYSKRAHKPTALRSGGKSAGGYTRPGKQREPAGFDPLENLRRRRERAFLLELRRASLPIVASERDSKEVTSATLVTGTRVASQTSRGFVGSGEGCQWLRCSQVPRPSLRSTDRRVGGAGL